MKHEFRFRGFRMLYFSKKSKKKSEGREEDVRKMEGRRKKWMIGRK